MFNLKLSLLPGAIGMSSEVNFASQPPEQLLEDSIEEPLQPIAGIKAKPDTTTSGN
jgi:hypothetical protein